MEKNAENYMDTGHTNMCIRVCAYITFLKSCLLNILAYIWKLKTRAPFLSLDPRS